MNLRERLAGRRARLINAYAHRAGGHRPHGRTAQRLALEEARTARLSPARTGARGRSERGQSEWT